VARPRRIASYAVALAALWLGGLVIADVALEDRIRQAVADRLADAVQGDSTIARGDLALVRGSLELADLAVRRDDPAGHLVFTMGSFRCDLLPLGLALVEHRCRELAIRGSHLEVSMAALLRLRRPTRTPRQVGRVVIDDARFELLPSEVVPNLGRVAIAIEHAEAGDTVWKTPLSWIFALGALRATVEVPAGTTVQLSYAQGELRVSGGIWGAAPVALPVALPVRDAADDPAAELAKLVAFGKDVARQLVVRRAGDWLKSKLAPP
jgi:hypothetical protein